ncbi:hypothetical protein BKA82DRAFT_4341367 [Pisolithus tinctorius]|nr:hypothetical protein BKA82DRAFT_4341367 [Pisolithus tinctorius]
MDIDLHAVISLRIIADMDGAGNSSVANDLVLCSGGEGALEHVCGDLAEAIKANALGGDADGVLRKYINAMRRRWISSQSIIRIPDLLSYEEASTLPCKCNRDIFLGREVGDSEENGCVASNQLQEDAWDEEITGGRGITGGSNTLQQSSGVVKDSGVGGPTGTDTFKGKQEIPVNTVI